MRRMWVCWVRLSRRKVEVKGPVCYDLNSDPISKRLTEEGTDPWGEEATLSCRISANTLTISRRTSSVHQRSVDGREVVLYPNRVLSLDGYQLSLLLNQARRSPVLRKGLHKSVLVLIVVGPTQRHFLDIIGNTIANSYLVHKCEMETALSWLSTLGGAFSALGDISASWAEQAGQVSLTQFRIAMKLGDPLIASRCRLYAAISLLQRGSLKTARRVIRQEYQYALSLAERQDPKLIRMCFGVWAKLQYAWTMHSLHKNKALS